MRTCTILHQSKSLDMKRVLCIAILGLLYTQDGLVAQNYTNGDILHVVASSGLRMRTSPNAQAGTLRVLECGEAVTIENTFEFDSTYRDKSGWFDGHWIYVNSEGISGYMFDAYLTSLAIPNHENELCFESMPFSVPLQEYLMHHYPVEMEEQGSEHREDIDQCIVYHAGGITVTRTAGSGWNKTDLVFQGYRFAEVVNLFRSMLVGDEMKEEFDSNLIFHQNGQGQVYRAKVTLNGYGLNIESRRDGRIHVSMTELHTVDRT